MSKFTCKNSLNSNTLFPSSSNSRKMYSRKSQNIPKNPKKTPKMCQNLPVRILWTPIHCSHHHQTIGKCSHRSFRCHQLERLFWTASANAFCSVFRKDIPSWNWSAWKYFFWKSSLFFNLVFIGFYIQIICSNWYFNFFNLCGFKNLQYR